MDFTVAVVTLYPTLRTAQVQVRYWVLCAVQTDRDVLSVTTVQHPRIQSAVLSLLTSVKQQFPLLGGLCLYIAAEYINTGLLNCKCNSDYTLWNETLDNACRIKSDLW